MTCTSLPGTIESRVWSGISLKLRLPHPHLLPVTFSVFVFLTSVSSSTGLGVLLYESFTTDQVSVSDVPLVHLTPHLLPLSLSGPLEWLRQSPIPNLPEVFPLCRLWERHFFLFLLSLTTVLSLHPSSLLYPHLYPLSSTIPVCDCSPTLTTSLSPFPVPGLPPMVQSKAPENVLMFSSLTSRTHILWEFGGRSRVFVVGKGRGLRISYMIP